KVVVAPVMFFLARQVHGAEASRRESQCQRVPSPSRRISHTAQLGKRSILMDGMKVICASALQSSRNETYVTVWGASTEDRRLSDFGCVVASSKLQRSADISVDLW